MKLAITGADGRIGTVLRLHWQDRYDLVTVGSETDLRHRGSWEGLLAGAATVVHLAANLDHTRNISVMKDNIEMLINVIRAAEAAERIVYASSMWAVHEQTALGTRGTYYSASKRAGEAIIQGWSDVHRRPAISLRIGHFGTAVGSLPYAHELLRVDDATLRWWFDQAIAHGEPRLAVWQVTGLSGHLDAARAGEH
jgi:nucleoside-diphosphate-sugar epimerase